jgi:hypothetical protein
MELFGSMPDTLKFVVVFVVILGILIPLVWRWFNVGPLRHAALHGRQQRLSVVETAMVDVRHRLVLVKRDNVEHLLLVGGPSNVVVESNIARSAAVAREPRPIPDARPEGARQPGAETPDWSLPLEPVARPVHMVDLDAALPEPPARTAREAMADSMRAVRSGAAARRTPVVDLKDVNEDIAAPALSPGEANHRAAQPQRGPSAPEADASNDGSPEPKRALPPAPRPAQPAPAAAAPAVNSPARPSSVVPPAATPPARPAAAVPPPATDQGNFAEMAQRLEAALRRPTRTEAPPPARQPRQEPLAGRRPASPDASRARAKSADVPPPDLKVLPGKGQNELAMENLEDEMAKMLGRPGKS